MLKPESLEEKGLKVNGGSWPDSQLQSPRKNLLNTHEMPVLWAKTIMVYAIQEDTGGNNTDQIFIQI